MSSSDTEKKGAVIKVTWQAHTLSELSDIEKTLKPDFSMQMNFNAKSRQESQAGGWDMWCFTNLAAWCFSLPANSIGTSSRLDWSKALSHLLYYAPLILFKQVQEITYKGSKWGHGLQVFKRWSSYFLLKHLFLLPYKNVIFL